MIDKLSYLWSVITDSPKPDVVSINLTPYCNQHCKYCEIGNGKVHPIKPLLTKEDVMWVIDQMAMNKISLLSMGGGEPLLVEWLWDIIVYAHEKGIATEVVTNGMLIPKLTQPQLNILRTTKHVSVSIDTPEPLVQNWLRGVDGAFDKQITGLQILKREGISFSVATVITDHNYYSLSKLVTLVDIFGATHVKFQPVWKGSNFPGVNGIDKTLLVVSENHVPALIESLRTVVKMEPFLPVKTNASDILDWIEVYLSGDRTTPVSKSFVNIYRCHTLHLLITINYYGGILPCNYLKAIENIKDRQPLVESWTAACSDVRNILKGGGLLPECKDCVCSFELGLVCSGIRYPISNYKFIPRMVIMAIKKVLK